jgi:hypothetical protein
MTFPTYMVGVCWVRAGSADPKKRAKMRRSGLISSIERLSFGGQPPIRGWLGRSVGPVVRTKGSPTVGASATVETVGSCRQSHPSPSKVDKTPFTTE